MGETWKQKKPQTELAHGILKSHRSDLNRRPMLYESIALPTELRWRLVAESATWGGFIVAKFGNVKANSARPLAEITRAHDALCVSGRLR